MEIDPPEQPVKKSSSVARGISELTRTLLLAAIVFVGARTVVLPHTTIGADVTIGEQGLIYSGVRIGDRVSIGARAIIHYNAVIGSDGFSFLPTPAAIPVKAQSTPGRIAFRITPGTLAPSAIRMPISRVRSATEPATSP